MKFARITYALSDETEAFLPNEVMQTKFIVQMASRLRGSTLQKALELALSMHIDTNKMEALTSLAPFLTNEQLPPVIEVAIKSPNEYQRRLLLEKLPITLPSKYEEKLLKSALELKQDWDRAHVLLTLGPKLSGEIQQIALRAGLLEALEFAAGEFDDEIMLIFNHYSNKTLIVELIKAIIDIKDNETQAFVFDNLLSFQKVYDDLPKLVQLAMAEHLYQRLYTSTREQLLRLCSTDTLFTVPTFSYSTLKSIAGHIENVCNTWEWL